MTEELRLPPHIENKNGAYWNTRTMRWVGAYKIKQVCDEYWANNDLESLTVETANGTVAYKKPKKTPLLNATTLNEKLSSLGQRPTVLNKKEYQPGEENKPAPKPKVSVTAGYDFADEEDDVPQDDIDISLLDEDEIEEEAEVGADKPVEENKIKKPKGANKPKTKYLSPDKLEETSDDKNVDSANLQETRIPLVELDLPGDSVEEVINRFRKAEKIFNEFAAADTYPVADVPSKKEVIKRLTPVTKKEKQFLGLICKNITYKEIASIMQVSPRTVDSYRDSLFKKLKVKKRTGLCIYSMKNGFGNEKLPRHNNNRSIKMEEPIKFNKSFEALYKSAMTLADNVIVKKELEARFEKLGEEYQELIEEFERLKNCPDILKEDMAKIKDEFGDVLFVLLHVAHQYNFKAFDLLHGAMSKMLARMNDPSYVAKN